MKIKNGAPHLKLAIINYDYTDYTNNSKGPRDICIFWPLLSKLKNREEFEEGLHEKRKGKGGKEEERKK